jgi:hypothetical protein
VTAPSEVIEAVRIIVQPELPSGTLDNRLNASAPEPSVSQGLADQ